MSFLDELARQGIVRQEDAPNILRLVNETGKSVETVLLENGVNEQTLMHAKGEYFKMPVKILAGSPVSFDVLQYIPENSARHYHFAPIGVNDGVLEVGITDPNNIDAMDALQFISSKTQTPFKVFLISEADYQTAISGYGSVSGADPDDQSQLLDDSQLEDRDLSGGTEGGAPEVQQPGGEEGRDDEEASADQSLQEDLQQQLNRAEKIEDKEKKKTGTSSKGDKSHIVEDAPVSKMVAVILQHAAEGNASDIHIEHTGKQVRVRFRIDGDLHTSIILPTNVHAAVISRIKILSNLKLDEKRKPQDGRFSAKIDGRRIDFRVSTYPAYYGEKVVMRLLDSEKGIKSIDDIGFSESGIKKIRNALGRPYGMILITGPTGSGKSTTLYSMLNELDRQKDNVVSLEDPIEYNIEGINQSNVRPDIGYTFATGLRSILRQDPDVIMVGEIRDKETAQLAVQAALTGHLVFSTLHTNTAAGAIPRLIDMGIDPYLIAPTLILVMGQRLVRALCDGGGKPIPVDESMKKMFDTGFEDLPEKYRKEIVIPDHVYEAQPTSDCPVGTRGRQAVVELLEVDAAVRHTILKEPVETEVFQVARKNGMLTMKEDAILKAFSGKIPYVEVNTL